MTKDLLQKELLEKVRPGMKPSDIKKQKKPIILLDEFEKKSKSNQDEGYASDKSDKSVPVAPPLPNSLQAQINSLQRQIQVYQDFKEADLKIKEGYKENINKLQEENKSLKENIADLQKPSKSQAKETKTQSTQTTPSHFYCDICQLTKQGTYLIRKIDSPFEPRTHHKLCYICSTCQKYTKEVNEKANWKEEDNPYKLYD